MAKWKVMTAHMPAGKEDSPFDPGAVLEVPSTRKLRWPIAADVIVRVWDLEDWPYTVDVELLRPSEADAPVVSGIRVYRNFLLEPKTPGKRERRFAEDLRPLSLSTRDVRRMPLDRILRAALVAATEHHDGRTGELKRALLPRAQGPKPEHSRKFYEQIARAYQQRVKNGEGSPVAWIAERKNVPRNRVYQWLHRARKMGLLEPSRRR